MGQGEARAGGARWAGENGLSSMLVRLRGTHGFLALLSPAAGWRFSVIGFAGMHRFVCLRFAVPDCRDLRFAGGTLVSHDGIAFFVLAAFREVIDHDDRDIPALGAGEMGGFCGGGGILGLDSYGFRRWHQLGGAFALAGGGERRH